jgi:ATP-dependent DNA helicase RecQ
LRERAPVSNGVNGEPLFDALRQWRSTEAKTQAVPPYVIFHDSVLHEISGYRPADLDALSEIKGVGASKLQRYGRAVLAIIRQHA